MTAQFHPPAEMLMDYASGALREAPSLIVATHLALCQVCRKETSKCEAIGGTLLEQGEAAPVSSSCRDKVMAMLDTQEHPHQQKAEFDPFLCSVLPAPLRNYVGCGVGQVQWQPVTSTLDQLEIGSCRCSAGRAKLVRLKAGATIPPHTHSGNEMSLILSGSLIDDDKTYHRGDFILHDASSRHSPKAAKGEDCVCLMVMDGKVILTGLLGRIINPFIHF